MNIIDWCERGHVPDWLARVGMRGLNQKRLWDEFAYRQAPREIRQRRFIQSLRSGPIAVHTADANRQHYEVPTRFFELALGKRLKYSCCYYPGHNMLLDDAEIAMLALTCERAQIEDGMRILELGCGWGSLSLWMAEHFPHSEIVVVSNSSTQKSFIDTQAERWGRKNLQVITADMAQFSGAGIFDRVVSVEMFEHMRNYEQLLANISQWLQRDGRLFVHYFCHRNLAYPFEALGEENWMARYFFTGGIMPSFDLLQHFPRHLAVEKNWWVDGTHYERTSNHWLTNLDANRGEINELFQRAYGPEEGILWVQRWRMFFMAVAELFGTGNGNTWGVGHYVLGRP